AGATRNRDEIIAEAATVAQQARDRHAVRFVAMLPNATFGAFVATRAQIHVEYENALAFVETLINVLGHERIDFAVAAESVERLFDGAASQHRKSSQHLDEIGATDSRELEVIQRRNCRGAYTRRNFSSGVKCRGDLAINLIDVLQCVARGKAKQTNF